MTDLTILLRALIRYTSETRHSKELSKLCNSVYNDLWQNTPDDHKGEKDDRDQFEIRFRVQIERMHYWVENSHEFYIEGVKIQNTYRTYLISAARSSEIFTNRWLLTHNITPDNPPEASMGATYDHYLDPAPEPLDSKKPHDNTLQFG